MKAKSRIVKANGYWVVREGWSHVVYTVCRDWQSAVDYALRGDIHGVLAGWGLL